MNELLKTYSGQSQSGKAFVDYSFFSEFSHPNAMALRQYVDYDTRIMTVKFGRSDGDATLSIYAISAYLVFFFVNAKHLAAATEMRTLERQFARLISNY